LQNYTIAENLNKYFFQLFVNEQEKHLLSSIIVLNDKNIYQYYGIHKIANSDCIESIIELI